MLVRIETLAPRRVAFVRHVGRYADCGAAWDRLTAVLGPEGLLGAGTTFVGLCHDDPDVTPPERLRYDACVSVDDDFVPSAPDVGVSVLAGGEYAVTTHVGPYSEMGDTYARLLGQWLPRSGRELAASPSFELYLNDPEGTDPEDLLTDIHAPLEPR